VATASLEQERKRKTKIILLNVLVPSSHELRDNEGVGGDEKKLNLKLRDISKIS
jgi:hypothetical protein